MPFASSIALSKVVTSSICPSRYRLEAAAAYRLSSAMPVGMFRLSVCAAPSLTFQRSSSRCTLLFCAPSLRTSSPAVSRRAVGSACCAKAPSPRELSSECETVGVSTVSPVFSTVRFCAACACRSACARAAISGSSTCVSTVPSGFHVVITPSRISRPLPCSSPVCSCFTASGACCSSCADCAVLRSASICRSTCRVCAAVSGSSIPYASAKAARFASLAAFGVNSLMVLLVRVPLSIASASCCTAGLLLCIVCASVCRSSPKLALSGELSPVGD